MGRLHSPRRGCRSLGVDSPGQTEESRRRGTRTVPLRRGREQRSRNTRPALASTDGGDGGTGRDSYLPPNSAFLMMAIDDKLPDLEDVKNGIKHVCKEFGITAIRADEIHASKHSRIGPKNPKNSVHAQIVGKPETAPVPAWLSPPARLQGM